MRLVPIALLSVVGIQCSRQPAREVRPSDADVSVARASSSATESTGPAPAKRAPTDQERDAQWVKERWPEETRAVRFESLAPKLASWVVEGGEIRAFITMAEHRCAPILLARPKGEGAEAGMLQGRVITEEKVVNGVRERTTFSATPGHWLHLESGGMTERFDGKEWAPVSGWGVGDGGSYVAVLSHVDAEIARWEGVGAELSAHCAGPVEALPCASGGERPCDRCLEVRLVVQSYRPSSGRGFGHVALSPRIAATCTEPCPKVSNEAIERVQSSESFRDAWTLPAADERRAPVPTLYRSESRCRRESPP